MIMQPEWVSAAQAAMRATRVPASVSLAQFGLESGWGQHMPPRSNNPFGIKAFHGGGIESETTEVIGGQVIHEDQPFAVYPDLATAFQAHAELISTDPRYAPAMAALPDLEGFVALMAKHYATAPNYAAQVLEIIRGDNLVRFDVAP
jgi:flagellum-specific peptidoglycan hydrolase FlgJ